MYNDIMDIKLTDTTFTPHHYYSLKHEFNPKKYSPAGTMEVRLDCGSSFSKTADQYNVWIFQKVNVVPGVSSLDLTKSSRYITLGNINIFVKQMLLYHEIQSPEVMLPALFTLE